MPKLPTSLIRCDWCGDTELYIEYHDHEWGVPLHNDQKLFELLTLEGAQAGLSWLTVLKRRNGYRKAFNDFDLKTVANFNERKVADLLINPEIIRNKLKINSAIKNAQVFLRIQNEFGSFDNYLWQYVEKAPIHHRSSKLSKTSTVDDIAVRLSKDLSKRGMKFVGPTICYAFMQASGIVNDHQVSCFRYKQLGGIEPELID